MEEKLEELREKYSQALREGDTDKATDYYWKAQELKQSSEEETEVELTFDSKYTDLDGVGEELAEELTQVFGSYDEFKEEAGKERLVNISGVGEKRAESLLEQVNE